MHKIAGLAERIADRYARFAVMPAGPDQTGVVHEGAGPLAADYLTLERLQQQASALDAEGDELRSPFITGAGRDVHNS